MSGTFFDSNVLFYTISRDDPRQARAASLLAEGGAISVQCLNEFVSVATRKLKLAWDVVHAARASLLEVCGPILPVTMDMHSRATALAERHKLSIYDALIVAAALEAGCDTLYSEDMHHGLVVDGRLTITNPFHA